MLDILEILQIQGFKVTKFNFGKFDKNYNIVLLYDRYDSGIVISPKEKKKFIAHMIKINPTIDVQMTS